MNFKHWFRDNILGWKTKYACMRDFKAVEEINIEYLKEDLRTALMLIENAEGQDRDGLPFSAVNFASEAIHLVRSAVGMKVRPPMYSRNIATLRQHIFGYYAITCKELAGDRAVTRLIKINKKLKATVPHRVRRWIRCHFARIQ